jgi:hypothetical protein
VISSWKDAVPTAGSNQNFLNYIEVPTYGCLQDKRTTTFTRPTSEVIDNIWCIGGDRGWYYGNWMWGLRGFIDKLF